MGGPFVAPLFARGGWNLIWRNRDSFIKSFSIDDARTRRRYIMRLCDRRRCSLAFDIGRRYHPRREQKDSCKRSRRMRILRPVRRKYASKLVHIKRARYSIQRRLSRQKMRVPIGFSMSVGGGDRIFSLRREVMLDFSTSVGCNAYCGV